MEVHTGISSKFGSKSGSLSPNTTSGGKCGSSELNTISPRKTEMSWQLK